MRLQLQINKKFTKILVAIVFFLWAAIVAKIYFSGFSETKTQAAESFSSTPKIREDNSNLDSKILLTNTNPFGITKKKSPKSTKIKVNNSIKVDKRNLHFLGYTYSKSKKLANISFNNKFSIKGELDTIGNFCLLKVLEDSILLSYQDQKFYVVKNK